MGWYVTPNGTLVDENDRMPGDTPYVSATTPASNPKTTTRTNPRDRWAGRKSTSPRPTMGYDKLLEMRKATPQMLTAGLPPTNTGPVQEAATSLTSSIPRAQSVNYLKSELERIKAYTQAMSPQGGKWGWRV